VNGEPEFGARLDSFSEMRWKLEASVLPLATSVDGRRFSLQASLSGLQLQAGSYVVLEGDGVSRLGRVLTLELDRELCTELTLSVRAGDARDTVGQVQIRYARGNGILVEGDPAPFHDVLVRVAAGRRCWRGCSASSGQMRSCASASSRWRPVCPAWRTPAALTGTRSYAVSPGQVRPTRSA
jgi:hypothetical protein